MTLRYSQEAYRRLQSLAPEIKKGVKALLASLREDPYLGKPLQRELEEFRSLAYKRHRIIYKIAHEDKEIRIYLVGHRKTIYEEIKEAGRASIP